MIELDQKTLKRLQDTELEMLVEIDRICRKYNIQYSLDGGTLLGAIRHQGFIPWDDDADVVMLREEYEKFYEACKTELDRDRFFLQEYRTDPYYRWGYSKLRRNGTVFLREGQEHGKWHQGVFLDIFLYDNVPDNPIIRRIHHFWCFFIRKALYSEVGMKHEKIALLRFGYSLLHTIPRDWLFRQLESSAARVNRKRTVLASHMTYPYPKRCRYGLPRECFNEYTNHAFAGYNFRVFREYDQYLKKLYGNYMELPPMSERKVHPVSSIRLLEPVKD